MIARKRCPTCGKTRVLSGFSKDVSTKDKKDIYCKICSRKEFKIWYLKHPKEKREKARKYARTHRKEMREYKQKQRLSALQKVSGLQKPLCANCGCDYLPFLEINHINGGGGKEKRGFGRGDGLFRYIITGRRKVDDLNVLCKVCNSLHYLELKHGYVPMEVIWKAAS